MSGFLVVYAKSLRVGDVLALPFNRRATITDVKVGRRFVTLKYSEYPSSRIELYEEVMIVSR